MRRKIACLIIVILILIGLGSCARAPKTVIYPEENLNVLYTPALARQDIYHTVAPGETLWRISKMYDVSIEEIMWANNLKNRTVLEMGQKLIVPNAGPLRPVIALYPSNKWKYIVIHHSASDEGNALAFDKSHRNFRGWQTLGYHFVIDNGTLGKQNGQIEVAPRWIKQMKGAHCKAGSMNYKGIGICLVGNFSREKVSPRQMDSLVYLVNTLKKYYKIPKKNIIGHNDVPGASTECPGKKFPWKEFKSRIED